MLELLHDDLIEVEGGMRITITIDDELYYTALEFTDSP